MPVQILNEYIKQCKNYNIKPSFKGLKIFNNFRKVRRELWVIF